MIRAWPVVAVAFMTAGSASVSFAQDAAQPPVPREQAATSGESSVARDEKGVQVRLFDLDGKTPLAARKALLVNVDTGDRIAELVANDKGEVRLPELLNGSYMLVVDGINYYFELRDDRPLKTLKILMPAAASGLSTVEAATSSVLFWVGAGTGVVIAGVGGGVLGYNLRHGRDGDTIVQPDPVPAVIFEASPNGDYGDVVTGTTRDLTFTLRNLSGLNTYTATISVSGSAFQLISSSSVTLLPHGTANVTVRFAPSTTGTFTGTVSAAPAGIPPQSRSLTGQGVSPSSVSPPGPP